MNRYEAEARADKAWKLARWLTRNGYRWEQVYGWSQDQWDTAAEEVGVRSPSEKTQGLVVGFLTARQNGRSERSG